MDVDSADSTFGAENEGFVSRFDADLALQKSTFYGGGVAASGATLPEDGVNAVAVANDVFIAGFTRSSDIPGIITADPASTQSTHGGGGGDGFIARLGVDLTSAQAPVATYLGQSGDDEIRDIFLDSPNAFVAGRTTSNDFPGITPGSSFRDTRVGGYDGGTGYRCGACAVGSR